jgi:hypothetical protein
MANKVEIIISAKDVTTKTLKTVGNSLKSVAKAGVMAGAALAGVGTALFAIAKTTASAGDQFQKMAQKIGVSAEALSELKHAAELSGTSIETVGMGFRLLSKRMLDAQEGLAEAKRTFDRLGISVQDSSGRLRDADTVFMDAVDAINKLGSETEKTALAQELFGRSGTELLPLVRAGKDGIAAMRREAKELGITFNQVEANQAAAFEDAMTRLKRAFTGLKNSMGKELIPVLTRLAESFTEKIPEITKKIDELKQDEWAKTAGETATLVIANIIEAIGWMPTAFFSVNEAIQKTISFVVALGAAALDVAAFVAATMNPWWALKLAGKGLQGKDLGTALRELFPTLARYKDRLAEIGGGHYKASLDAAESAKKFAEFGVKLENIAEKIRNIKITPPDAEVPDTPKKDTVVSTKIREALEAYEKLSREVSEKIKSITLDETEYKISKLREWYENTKAIYNAAGKDTTALSRLYGLEYQKILDEKQAKERELLQDRIESEQEANEKIVEATEQIYADLDSKDEKYYEFKRKLIEEQAAEYLQILQDIQGAEELVNKWRKEQLKELNEEQNEAQKSIAEALKDAWNDYASKTKSVFEQIADFTTQAFDKIFKGFGNAVGQMIVYGKDFGSAMKSIFADILSSFISMVAQMTAKWLAFKALTALGFGGLGGIFGFAEGGIVQGGLRPIKAISAAAGGVFTSPTLAMIGDNPERQEAVIPMKHGKVPVELRGERGGTTIAIRELNIMPNANIDEALFDKPLDWWTGLARERILPALNELGEARATTTLRFREV